MNKIFTIEALPARKGDCLLLHYGTTDKQKLWIIDGGPSKVYKPHLRPRLKEIKEKRGFGDNGSLPVELLMISHIDDDHIKGILDMTKDLIKAKDDQEPLYLDVRDLWHNSFDDIIGNQADALAFDVEAQFGTASVGGGSTGGIGSDFEDTTKVLASVGQGRDLRNAAKKLEWTVNFPFPELVMMQTDSGSQVDKFAPDLQLKVIGPMRDELIKLQKTYDKYLKDKKLGTPMGEDALSSFDDKSAANLSSLVVLVEAEGKSILLTGDARGDKILKSLEMLSLIEDDKPFEVDVLKMPHHGSNRNVTTGFFEKVIADHYISCGDGEHGNPERETMEMIFDARPNGGFDLHFTYAIEEIDKTRRKEMEDDGKTWSPKSDGLVELFKQKKDAGVDFKVIEPEDDQGIRVDLLKKYPH